MYFDERNIKEFVDIFEPSLAIYPLKPQSKQDVTIWKAFVHSFIKYVSSAYYGTDIEILRDRHEKQIYEWLHNYHFARCYEEWWDIKMEPN